MEEKYKNFFKFFFDKLSDEERINFLNKISERILERLKKEDYDYQLQENFQLAMDEILEFEKNEVLKQNLSNESKIKIISNIILQRILLLKDNKKMIQIIEEELKNFADELIKKYS